MKKLLFWSVLIIWIALTAGVYAIGATNSWVFHDDSLITYTTSGMTNQQASSLYEYINSFTDKDGVNKYSIPTFVPSTGDSSLLILDNGNNTYIEELQIPNYPEYGLSIKNRGQSEGMVMLYLIIGAVLLVFGGIIGIQDLYLYAYNKKEFDYIFHNTPKTK